MQTSLTGIGYNLISKSVSGVVWSYWSLDCTCSQPRNESKIPNRNCGERYVCSWLYL